MTALLAGRDASIGRDRAARYARQRSPEQTLLDQIVEAHFPAFLAELAARDRTLPAYVQREFEDYLTCGRLEHGFLRVRCSDCHAERRVAFSCKRRGLCPRCGARRMAESAALVVDEIFPRLAPSPRGAERAFATPIFIGPRATSDRVGAGHRLPRDCDHSGPSGGFLR